MPDDATHAGATCCGESERRNGTVGAAAKGSRTPRRMFDVLVFTFTSFPVMHTDDAVADSNDEKFV